MNKKTIDAFIFDDEPGAIQTLMGMLAMFCPNIRITRTATSVNEGLMLLQEQSPDLLFLDIEMPPFGNGFDLIKASPKHDFGIIFITAHPEYAIQAINDIQPWGYLVKPYRVTDLVNTIDSAGKKIFDRLQNEPTQQNRHGIIVNDRRKGKIVIHARDILYCVAESGTTDIFVMHSNSAIEKISTFISLKNLESQLPASYFCRTHHSYLVNLTYIKRYQRTGRNGVIYLSSNHKVSISVQKLDVFETAFNAFLKGDHA